MISLEEIEETIIELERNHDTTFAAVSKLADLYVVRDHLRGLAPMQRREQEKIASGGDGEFAQAIRGKPVEAVMEIMRDLMDDTLKNLSPRLYDAVMRKIKEI